LTELTHRARQTTDPPPPNLPAARKNKIPKLFLFYFNVYTVRFISAYTVTQQMHYNTTGILMVLLTTTTGCIDSLTYVVKPYAH
jgi:hypothetical protein